MYEQKKIAVEIQRGVFEWNGRYQVMTGNITQFPDNLIALFPRYGKERCIVIHAENKKSAVFLIGKGT
jgi:hypothetical protein